MLRRERDDSFRDLNACKEQSRAWLAEVTRWKAEARPRPVPPLYSPPFLLMLTSNILLFCRQIVR